MVTTNSGRRFFLGAPVSSPVMRDPLFLNRVDQIISYWGRAIEDFLKPEDRATSDPALRARQTTARPGTRKAGPGGPGPYLRFLRLVGWLAAVGLLVLGAVLLFFGIRDVGPSWAAHLGHGVPGVLPPPGHASGKTARRPAIPRRNGSARSHRDMALEPACRSMPMARTSPPSASKRQSSTNPMDLSTPTAAARIGCSRRSW